jgi:hypothetical protein
MLAVSFRLKSLDLETWKVVLQAHGVILIIEGLDLKSVMQHRAVPPT